MASTKQKEARKKFMDMITAKKAKGTKANKTAKATPKKKGGKKK